MIEVMLSSTVTDLVPDREAVAAALTGSGVVRLLGLLPVVGPSYSGSGYVATMDMATNCHLYILLLGHRYGYRAWNGKSATELEYEAAYKADPTKILVFRRNLPKFERKQTAFAARVGQYQRGYYIREYGEPAELDELTRLSFQQWLEDRAAIGQQLAFFDHFIRLAVQRSPFPGVRPSYTVNDDYLELKYRFLGRSYTVHFDKAHIFIDFWGSIATLEDRFNQWRSDQYGRGA